jgi:hypothetical protein
MEFSPDWPLTALVLMVAVAATILFRGVKTVCAFLLQIHAIQRGSAVCEGADVSPEPEL